MNLDVCDLKRFLPEKDLVERILRNFCTVKSGSQPKLTPLPKFTTLYSVA